eukprot:227096-Amorphochlora_amoeboformis.AAC.3
MGLSVGTLGTSQPVPRDSGALAPYFLRLRGGGWQNPVTQWLEAKPVFDEHWTLNGPHLINKRKYVSIAVFLNFCHVVLPLNPIPDPYTRPDNPL